MASLNLTPDELKALEATRSRLYQLANSIGSLKNDIYQSNPLPRPASLRNSAYILQQNLASLLAVTAEHASLFQRVVVHPSTNYPGRAQENVLMQLLRKKLEPDVESLVETGRGAALAAGLDPRDSFVSLETVRAERARARARYGGEDDDDDDDEDNDDDDDDDEDAELPQEPLGGLGDAWADARDWYMERVMGFIRGEAQDPYTAAERALGVENVRTGLRRPLEDDDDDSDDDDDDDDDEEDVVMQDGAGPPGAAGAAQAAAPGPGEEPERMLWFVARGDADMPSFIETERQRLEREGRSQQRV